MSKPALVVEAVAAVVTRDPRRVGEFHATHAGARGNQYYAKLARLLARLDHARLRYTVAHYRKDAPVSVQVAVPGERWEIDLLADGKIEFERFVSDGAVVGEVPLRKLIRLHAHPSPTPAVTDA